MAKQDRVKPPLFRPSPLGPHLTHQEMAALKHISAGAVTGGVGVIIIYPSGYLKTVMQLDEMGKRSYRGAWHCFTATVKAHGFKRLYRGFPITFFGSVPQIAVRFTVFDYLRENMESDHGHLSNLAKIFCGTSAGVIEAVTVITPVETLKVKYIDDLLKPQPKFKGIFHCIRSIVKKEGWVGMYQGQVATTIKQSGIQAILFFVIENLKDLYKGDDIHKKIPSLVTGLMGVCAGTFATIASNPIDVLKTRLQSSEGSKYKSTLDCAIQLYKQQGIRGYYTGLVPRLFRVCLDVSITFMIYDALVEFLDQNWPG